MHAGRRVALVIPALDEESSVAGVVHGFRARPETDLVIVVDNGSRDRTSELARGEGAVIVAEPRRGYGTALRTGIEHALALGAEVVVLAEADGTFEPNELADLLRALAGMDGAEVDLVLGSRAVALGGLLGAGNRAVARLLSALWIPHSCRLTDVGCTYRAFRAGAWARIGMDASPPGPEFSPWMIGASFRARLRVREIPVSYSLRTSGDSKHTGSPLAVLRTALRMLRAIVAQRPRRA